MRPEHELCFLHISPYDYRKATTKPQGLKGAFIRMLTFYLQPGISFLSCHRQSSNNVSLLHIPVYASYRLPVKEVTWRFNLGPYAQLGNDYDFGISAEIGLEYNRWFGGIHAYQTVIPDEMSGIFGLSFGYKFQIR